MTPIILSAGSQEGTESQLLAWWLIIETESINESLQPRQNFRGTLRTEAVPGSLSLLIILHAAIHRYCSPLATSTPGQSTATRTTLISVNLVGKWALFNRRFHLACLRAPTETRVPMENSAAVYLQIGNLCRS
jgi:hypothetical protein